MGCSQLANYEIYHSSFHCSSSTLQFELLEVFVLTGWVHRCRSSKNVWKSVGPKQKLFQVQSMFVLRRSMSKRGKHGCELGRNHLSYSTLESSTKHNWAVVLEACGRLAWWAVGSSCGWALGTSTVLILGYEVIQLAHRPRPQTRCQQRSRVLEQQVWTAFL